MRRSRLFLSLSAAGILLILATGIMSASFLGGRWPWSGGSLLYLSYRNDAGAYPAYSSAVSSAASSWYYTPTPLVPYSVGGSANIVANTVWDGSGGYWGITHIYADERTCIWFICWSSRNEIPYKSYNSPGSLGSGWSDYRSAFYSLNRATLNSESQFIKQKVAAHEMGHTFGLGHTSCRAIMRQGYVSWNTPQPNDNYDIDWLYPSTWSTAYGC